MTITDLKETEYNAYYGKYLNLIPRETSLIEGFKKDLISTLEFFQSIPSDKLNFKYAKDKWSVKEVFQHLIDTERVFQYRCFRIARHDSTSLSGFDENNYTKPSQASNKSIEALLEEFKTVRQSFMVLLNSLGENDLKFVGEANGSPLSARAAAFIILGHTLWHINVIKERYL